MSTNNSNHLVNPAAREAMDKFKMEAASEEDGSETSKNPDSDTVSIPNYLI